jgi:homoserine O-succinyltransferase
LKGVPRTDRGQRHLNEFYFSSEDLWDHRFDAVIITGTEPRQPDLRQEPYWSALAEVFDWAERNTFSTVLSCLAAHAGVLHSDGIQRYRLSDKQFGVFEFSKTADHTLTTGVDPVRFPHSRWNEVRTDELAASGYTVLAQSAEGGVDSFAKKKRQSLFVHFQGHPEYGAQTLLKEYRRDIRRFLQKERETYPTMPKGYFDVASAKLLAQFQQTALADPSEKQLAYFPEAVVKMLERSWRSSATRIYRNWLEYVLTKKAEVASFAAIPGSYTRVQPKRSAVL